MAPGWGKGEKEPEGGGGENGARCSIQGSLEHVLTPMSNPNE